MVIAAQSLCPLIQVFDMPTSLAFYCDALGFESMDGTDNWQLLRLGDAWLMLNTAYEAHDRPSRPEPGRIAAHRDTGLFIGVEDADAVFAELTAKGLTIKPPRTVAYGMRQLYLLDPDGYEICFQHPSEYIE